MSSTTIRTSRGGIDYLTLKLSETPRTVAEAVFWRIPHNTQRDEIRLRIARYAKASGGKAGSDPKNSITIRENEIENLVEFISSNYAPLKAGERTYIPVEGSIDATVADQLRKIFQNKDKQAILDLVLDNELLPEEVLQGVQLRKKQAAVAEFRRMLEQDLVEKHWQKWFEKNSWVLGSEFVRVLGERSIDTANIADYLMQAYDGFLDIVEIKRPGGGFRFWSVARDHENLVPSSDLTKAITQSLTYLYEVEREVNSVKFMQRLDGVEVIKPRCVLVFGRSNDWGDDERRAYRILNSSFHSVTIMTYDHVLARAERMIAPNETASFSSESGPQFSQDIDDEIPF